MTQKEGKGFIQRWLSVSTVLVFILYSSAIWALDSSYRIAEPADWVELATVPEEPTNVSSLAQDGLYYKLYDRQINAIDPSNRSAYRAFEFKLTNKTGVEENSTVEIDFDPEYRSVVLHELGIFRNGQYIDKLKTADIQVLRTEDKPEFRFYNSVQTITAVLQDVRVGDTVRYSYTYEGANPAYDDLVEHGSPTQFYFNLAKASFRILVDANTQMTIRTRELPTTTDITESVRDGIRTYSWSGHALTQLDWVDDEPQWTRHEPAFAISSVSSWKDIVDWALPKYRYSDAKSDELTLVAGKISEQHASVHAQIGAALKWVQDEIRYFGCELGGNPRESSTPAEILARRHSDCIDKAVVLISLLAELGIEAHPALVNTDGELHNESYQYRLHAFDQVVVHVRVDGESHWIDPTLSDQSGAVGDFYEPYYGKALILAEGQTDLTAMGLVHSAFEYQSHKQFTVNSEDDSRAQLAVRTKRQGYSAERHRGNLSNKGLLTMQDEYLEYYRGWFNYIDRRSDLQYKELKNNHSFELEEYVLEQFWETDHDWPYYRIVADETRAFLYEPKAPQYRKRPYQLGHPNVVTDVNVFKLAEDVESNTGSRTISNDYFTYTVEVEQSSEKNDVMVSHRYESHALLVPAKDMESYAKDIEAAREISILILKKDGFFFGEDIVADSNTEDTEKKVRGALELLRNLFLRGR